MAMALMLGPINAAAIDSGAAPKRGGIA